MLFMCGREVQTKKKISVFENIRIRVETASGIAPWVLSSSMLVVCTTLTMAIALTSLLLSFCSSVSGCGCGFRFEKKYLRIDGFGQKKARICIPLSTPLYSGLSFKRRYHLSPLGLATVNPVVLTVVKICSGFR